jgi:lipopolysaccharide/colanic/teichoic acid biosynthesis glycosyltransferase
MVSFLGSDGTGKSSLVRALPDRVRAAFLASPVVYKFRPDSTHRIVPALDPEPHVREPRSLPTSVLKVAFYAGDWWIGWLRQLLPAQRRGALVLFDRDFADLSADQRRYLVRDVGALSRTVRRLIPRPAVTYVLDASPDVVHARKPELTITELERQRAAYRRLCEHDPRMRLVDAHETTEHVLEAVASDLVMALARRERLRAIPPLTRLRDVAVSAGALVCLSPLMAATALAVRARLGSPILFRQSRPGLLGAPFDLLKFRTMTEDLDPVTGRHRPDAERMTALGTLLRRTSLDELPELLNVLKGDMSLVGPRPLLPRYLPRYSAEQRGRHDVLPGVTGWAQVNGRNAASWDEKFALDLWYVDHRTFWLDLRILLRTAAVVVGGRGVSQPGHATGEEFWGSDGAPGSASPPGQPQGPLERTS